MLLSCWSGVFRSYSFYFYGFKIIIGIILKMVQRTRQGNYQEGSSFVFVRRVNTSNSNNDSNLSLGVGTYLTINTFSFILSYEKINLK